MNESEVLSQFSAALEARGIIPPKPIDANGRLHRCDVEGKHGKKDAAYVLHMDGLPAGGFENHRDGLGWQDWQAEPGRILNPEEQQAHRKRVEAMRKDRQADEQQRHTQARQRATGLWKDAPTAQPNNSYLVKKDVCPHGLRVYKDRLMVPVRDAQGALHSLQFIDADGNKRFLSGGRKQGCFHLIGQPTETLCIAEGYATAASIHEATGYPVAVAFDAGNLADVAKELRKAYPNSRLIICADDDRRTPGNPGMAKATVAAVAVKGFLAVPDFGRARPDWASDFNDLTRLNGPMSVAVQIDTATAPGADSIEIIELEDVVAEPVAWLWSGRFALGKLSLLAGYPGLGKSQVTAGMAAVVTTGGTWPVTGEAFGPPADVLFLSAEDDPADTIKPRLQAAEADLRRCRILGSVQAAPDGKRRAKRRCFSLLEDLEHLDRVLTRHPAKLVIIDPLSAYMGDSRKVDTHKTSDVRSILAPLVELAGKHRVAMVGIFHLNKREGSSAMDRINGSGAFVAAARAVWLVAKDREEPACRLFVQVKNNLAPDQSGLKFEIQSREVDSPNGPIPTSNLLWRPDVVTMDADEALSGGWGGERRDTLGEVMGFLEDLLANGPRGAKEVLEAAKAAGHSEKSVYRAKKKLGITAAKGRGKHTGWEWSLPNKDGQDSQDGQDTHLETWPPLFDHLTEGTAPPKTLNKDGQPTPCER